jgi:hypothetical protein
VESVADSNIYITHGILILLYVDDLLVRLHISFSTIRRGISFDSESIPTLLICYENGGAVHQVKQQLKDKYEVADLGPVRRFLGMEIEWTSEGNYTLSQSSYIDMVLKGLIW